LQIADLSFERQKLQEKLQSISENGQRTIQLLEAKMKIVEDDLKESKSKASVLQTEFDNYKLKAQHAFKKQKEQNDSSNSTVPINEVQKYLTEIDSLKSLTVKLSDELAQSNEKYQILEKEFDLVQEEYSRCLNRNTSLLNELKEKEIEWKSK
jgi:chromosome segregation ATPase